MASALKLWIIMFISPHVSGCILAPLSDLMHLLSALISWLVILSFMLLTFILLSKNITSDFGCVFRSSGTCSLHSHYHHFALSFFYLLVQCLTQVQPLHLNLLNLMRFLCLRFTFVQVALKGVPSFCCGTCSVQSSENLLRDIPLRNRRCCWLWCVGCLRQEECCFLHACFILIHFRMPPADTFKGCFNHVWVGSPAFIPLIASPIVF